MTQVRLACAMCRSRWMTGSATFTTEPSSVFMSIAMQTTPSAIQRRLSPLRVGAPALIARHSSNDRPGNSDDLVNGIITRMLRLRRDGDHAHHGLDRAAD